MGAGAPPDAGGGDGVELGWVAAGGCGAGGTAGGGAGGVCADAPSAARKAVQRGTVPFMGRLGFADFRGDEQSLLVDLDLEVEFLAALDVGAVEGCRNQKREHVAAAFD